jgi:hypothetical protein
MGYWGSILVIGMLHRLWTYTRSAHVGSDDAEHGWHSRASPNKRNLASLRHYFNTHLVVPAAVRSYHQRRLWGCSIPNRLELLVVVGFWVMCIILNFGFYDIFTPNTRYDFNATSLSPKLSALTCSLRYQTTAHQVWKYVAQRTSVFAVACLPWVWLFAGRNNIFIWLTGWSFGTFNVFHRHLSRLTVLFAIVHSIAHTVVETVYSTLLPVFSWIAQTNASPVMIDKYCPRLLISRRHKDSLAQIRHHRKSSLPFEHFNYRANLN